MGEGTPKLTCRPDVVARVPERLVRELNAFPLDRSGNEMIFAVARPLSEEERGELGFVLNCEILEEIYPLEAIRTALDDHYGEANPIERLVNYYPGSARILDDGAIEMGASGWDSGQGQEMQWSGCRSFSPGDPDYGLWRWVISQGNRFSWVITHPFEDGPALKAGATGLDAVREAYRREA
jgi:hypothetical protein